MKLNKISILVMGALVLASCNDIDDQNPNSGVYTEDQVNETLEAVETRAEGTFLGMFTMMGKPSATYGSSNSRDDDFGYISAAFSQDIEGADVIVQDNNYNWFATPADYTSRTASYANPYMRYKLPYTQIGVCNQIINSMYKPNTNKWAQAKAMRAFAYMSLAPYFAFGYSVDPSAPDIPILKEGVDYTNNPRASLKEVYDYIISDLDEAIAVLDTCSEQRPDKSQIDKRVAYGLRARANLAIGNYAAAAVDADSAIVGYKVASRDAVNVPSFYNIEDENWIWGIDITNAQVQVNEYATSGSWIGSFSSNGYAAACQCYACCNKLLYDKIPDTDVRKGWWVNEKLESPLLEKQKWDNGKGNTASGQKIATFAYDDKLKFLPYTNVKFGMMSGIGSDVNNNDWPLMRVEEMWLIKAEALARLGKSDDAITALKMVTSNRDTNYNVNGRGLSLLDEIWFQRRVELWGEGFFASDAKRLNRPIVRFHQGDETSNVPDAYKFNIAANDGWLNMRFINMELNNNKGIVDNTGGSLPVSGQNGDLRDGVTD